MNPPLAVDLTPQQAADMLRGELAQADHALQSRGFDAALDSYVRALGLALQLGPAAAEQVLSGIVQAARNLSRGHDADSLSALGPAMVSLVSQMRQAGALPSTPIMEAWATVADDLGMIIGQVGLALSIAPEHRLAMLDSAHTRCALLDDATGNLFAFTDWIKGLYPDS
jgi:hypothetical protein